MSEQPRWVRYALWVGVAWSGALVWLFSPLDPVPDLFPVLGWLDDLLVVSGAAAFTAWSAWRGLGPEALEGPAPSRSLGPRKPAYDPIPTDELRSW